MFEILVVLMSLGILLVEVIEIHDRCRHHQSSAVQQEIQGEHQEGSWHKTR